jgi:glutaredoxin 3
MYSTRYCGFCVAARKLLQRRGYVFEDVDVSHDNSLRHQISKQAGNYRTVPMIFINEEFIGGYEELAALDRNGELKQIAVQSLSAPANAGDRDPLQSAERH